jgi:hypothetical protein
MVVNFPIAPWRSLKHWFLEHLLSYSKKVDLTPHSVFFGAEGGGARRVLSKNLWS